VTCFKYHTAQGTFNQTLGVKKHYRLFIAGIPLKVLGKWNSQV